MSWPLLLAEARDEMGPQFWILAALLTRQAVLGSDFMKTNKIDDSAIYSYSGIKEPHCAGTICYSQEECCRGTVCITHSTDDSGLCARLLDQPEGKLCLIGEEKSSCVAGLKCIQLHNHYTKLGVCVNPNRVAKDKQYFDACETTIDCDINKELCCVSQVGFRRQPRQICSYYEDPLEECVF